MVAQGWAKAQEAPTPHKLVGFIERLRGASSLS